ncbi:MAG: hypothetical protein ABIG44_19560 [Planctomycetota bacterium]
MFAAFVKRLIFASFYFAVGVLFVIDVTSPKPFVLDWPCLISLIFIAVGLGGWLGGIAMLGVSIWGLLLCPAKTPERSIRRFTATLFATFGGFSSWLSDPAAAFRLLSPPAQSRLGAARQLGQAAKSYMRSLKVKNDTSDVSVSLGDIGVRYNDESTVVGTARVEVVAIRSGDPIKTRETITFNLSKIGNTSLVCKNF